MTRAILLFALLAALGCDKPATTEPQFFGVGEVDFTWSCNKASCEFTANKAPSEVGADYYHWNFGDAQFTQSTKLSVRHNYQCAGVDTVNLAAFSGPLSYGQAAHEVVHGGNGGNKVWPCS